MLGGVDMQTEFAAALRSQANGVPCCLKGAAQGRAERRFAVYRNTVAAGLIEALAGRFPVVERLVGEDFFRAMAHAYVTQEPPRSPLLFQYGGSFADFIAGFAPAAPLPYLRERGSNMRKDLPITLPTVNRCRLPRLPPWIAGALQISGSNCTLRCSLSARRIP
jgi:hypothetical protein